MVQRPHEDMLRERQAARKAFEETDQGVQSFIDTQTEWQVRGPEIECGWRLECAVALGELAVLEITPSGAWEFNHFLEARAQQGATPRLGSKPRARHTDEGVKDWAPDYSRDDLARADDMLLKYLVSHKGIRPTNGRLGSLCEAKLRSDGTWR